MLEQFFGSKTRLKLLYLFFRSPDRSYYVRELARLAETQLNAVRRELANLEKIEIVIQVPADPKKLDELGTERSKYYKLNTASLLYPELKALLLRAQVLEEQKLIELLKKKAGDIKLMLLSGVFTDFSESPTDILIVGNIKPLATAKLIREFEKIIGKPIRYTVMDEKEFSERHEIGDKFLYTIFEARHLKAVDEFHLN
jgi:hypothetical protein